MWDKLHKDDKVKMIQEGLKNGMSTSQIANWIGGCSRNAVIGLIHRKKLGTTKASKQQKGEPPPVRRKPAQPKPPVAVKSPPPARRDPLPPRMVRALPAIQINPKVPMLRRIPLMELKTDDCRFPIGDPLLDADFGFCANPRHGESSYCQFHFRVVHLPPDARRRLR